jgi:hypothetical protein
MTADAQLQLAEAELADVSVEDVQLLAPETPTGVGEAQVRAGPGHGRALSRGRVRSDRGPGQ